MVSDDASFNEKLHFIFMWEIGNLCEDANHCFTQIKKCLSVGNEPENRKNIWIFIKMYLNTTCYLSNIFWPPSKKCKQRGKIMCESFDLKGVELLKDKTFRHHITHYDERLEEWCTRSEMNLVSQSIIPWDRYPDPEWEDRHSIFNAATLEFSFHGKVFPLIKLHAEIEIIERQFRDWAYCYYPDRYEDPY